MKSKLQLKTSSLCILSITTQRNANQHGSTNFRNLSFLNLEILAYKMSSGHTCMTISTIKWNKKVIDHKGIHIWDFIIFKKNRSQQKCVVLGYKTRFPSWGRCLAYKSVNAKSMVSPVMICGLFGSAAKNKQSGKAACTQLPFPSRRSTHSSGRKSHLKKIFCMYTYMRAVKSAYPYFSQSIGSQKQRWLTLSNVLRT